MNGSVFELIEAPVSVSAVIWNDWRKSEWIGETFSGVICVVSNGGENSCALNNSSVCDFVGRIEEADIAEMNTESCDDELESQNAG